MSACLHSQFNPVHHPQTSRSSESVLQSEENEHARAAAVLFKTTHLRDPNENVSFSIRSTHNADGGRNNICLLCPPSRATEVFQTSIHEVYPIFEHYFKAKMPVI
jgi:hypothetical protein